MADRIKSGDLVQVKLYLSPDVHEQLRAASDTSGRSMSQLVDFMVEHFLDASTELLSPPPGDDPRIEEAKERAAGIIPRPAAAPSAAEDFVGE